MRRGGGPRAQLTTCREENGDEIHFKYRGKIVDEQFDCAKLFSEMTTLKRRNRVPRAMLHAIVTTAAQRAELATQASAASRPRPKSKKVRTWLKPSRAAERSSKSANGTCGACAACTPRAARRALGCD